MSPVETGTGQGGRRVRDQRVDFFRGAALLMVLTDHVEIMNGLKILSSWTLQGLGLSNCAEVFVFLSGYTYGMVYGVRLLQKGFFRVLRTSLWRAFQIYGASLLVLTAVIISVPFLRTVSHLFSGWPRPGSSFTDELVAGLLMSSRLVILNTLTLYVILIPLGALQLWLLNRNRLTAFSAVVVSTGLYAWTQWDPSLNLIRWTDGQVWYFNPFSWQFLFFLGMVCSRMRFDRWTARMKTTVTAGTVALTAAVLLDTLSPQYRFLQRVSTEWPFLTSRATAGPLLIIHFLAVAWLATSIVSRHSRLFENRVVRWVSGYGRHSLFFYSVGVVLSFLSIGLFAWFDGTLPVVILVIADLVVVSVAAHWCWNTSVRTLASWRVG